MADWLGSFLQAAELLSLRGSFEKLGFDEVCERLKRLVSLFVLSSMFADGLSRRPSRLSLAWTHPPKPRALLLHWSLICRAESAFWGQWRSWKQVPNCLRLIKSWPVQQILKMPQSSPLNSTSCFRLMGCWRLTQKTLQIGVYFERVFFSLLSSY